MVNYQNGKIYKIISNQTDKVYVGSTTQPLCERLSSHRSKYKRYLINKNTYITSFELVKYDDAKIILIENYPCQNKEELHAKEYDWMDKTENCVNKVISKSKNPKYVDYQDGKIYKLISNSTTDVYVGSTAMKTLHLRLCSHKQTYKRYTNKQDLTFMSSFKLLQFDDCKIELIENYPCDNVNELTKREGHWIKNTQNCINKIVAGRTDKEYRADNKIIVNKKKRDYRNNKPGEKERVRQYVLKNHDRIKKRGREYNLKNKEKKANYAKIRYNIKKDEILEYHKQYHEKNKERDNKQRMERYKKYGSIKSQCECGASVVANNKLLHLKSKKHKTIIRQKLFDELSYVINKFDEEIERELKGIDDLEIEYIALLN